MNHLEKNVRDLIDKTTLLPNEVNFEERLFSLFAVGKTNLSLAKLVEAHWDALSILYEASISAKPNALYAVWAAEIPNNPLKIEKNNNQLRLNGTKMFCSGAGIVERALVTADGFLIDVDLNNAPPGSISINNEEWITSAFKDTNTSTITFNQIPIKEEQIIGPKSWYLERSGFWKGALGPAACWGGGAAGLLEYALANSRQDPHTLAHLAAMDANIWTIRSILSTAGNALEEKSEPVFFQTMALRARHIIEQLSTDVLRRFARTYGPFPLACNSEINQRYHELDLFLRQNHGERDLESLGVLLKKNQTGVS